MNKNTIIILSQIVGIIFNSLLLVHVYITLNFDSSYNVLWVYFMPPIMAIIFNNKKSTQTIMTFTLMLIAFLIAMYSGVIYGFH